MQLFFNAHISENDTTFFFDKEECRHIVKVLRKILGNTLFVTNGKGWLFQTEITDVSTKHCAVSIISKTLHPKRPYQLHLIVAPTKMNDRFEWFLEKATEIGVDSITPIICERSERKVIKKDRFLRILQSAMKQSLQCYLPKLNDAMSFKEIIKQYSNSEALKFIAHCEETVKLSLKSQLNPYKNYVIFIGPEGDFTKQEIQMALNAQFLPVTLGQTRLRTETAAIVACHTAMLCNQFQ